MFCCSQTHYNGGCYFRLTARLQYPPQPIRERRETNEEQKLTITPQNFMPCTQSFSCAIIIIAAVWVPACDTLSPAPCYLIRVVYRLRSSVFALRTDVAKRVCIYNTRNWKSDIFFFVSVILFVEVRFGWIPSRDPWVLSKCSITEPKDSRRSTFQNNFAYSLFSALGKVAMSGEGVLISIKKCVIYKQGRKTGQRKETKWEFVEVTVA